MEIINKFLSDHKPITLIWKKSMIRLGMLFKFNRALLVDHDFSTLVKDTWSHARDFGSTPMELILEKLETLRGVVKN